MKKWIFWSNPDDSIKKKSIKRTIQVHLILLLFLSLGSTSFQTKRPFTRMKVRTYEEKVRIVKPSTPLKKKVETPQKAPAKKATTPPKEHKKEAPQLKKQEALRSLEKKLEAIESKLRENASTPKVEVLTPEATPLAKSNQDPYTAELIAYLRNLIRLPDQDQVIATITVQPNGEIVRIESIFSDSKLNVRVVETKILKAKLPPFEGTVSKTLTFVFCAE